MCLKNEYLVSIWKLPSTFGGFPLWHWHSVKELMLESLLGEQRPMVSTYISFGVVLGSYVRLFVVLKYPKLILSSLQLYHLSRWTDHLPIKAFFFLFFLSQTMIGFGVVHSIQWLFISERSNQESLGPWGMQVLFHFLRKERKWNQIRKL